MCTRITCHSTTTGHPSFLTTTHTRPPWSHIFPENHVHTFIRRQGQLPLLGVDIDRLQDHTPGHAFTDANSLVFELKVKYDDTKASVPVRHRVLLAKEQRVASELDRRFGPVSNTVLARVPAVLR